MYEDLKHKVVGEVPPYATPPEKLISLQEKFPGLPMDYLAFLEEIGTGEMGPFRLYSGPITAGSEFPHCAEQLKDVILFGDDLQGYCFGFDLRNNFRLVEVDPWGEMRELDEKTFRELATVYLELE